MEEGGVDLQNEWNQPTVSVTTVEQKIIFSFNIQIQINFISTTRYWPFKEDFLFSQISDVDGEAQECKGMYWSQWHSWHSTRSGPKSWGTWKITYDRLVSNITKVQIYYLTFFSYTEENTMGLNKAWLPWKATCRRWTILHGWRYCFLSIFFSAWGKMHQLTPANGSGTYLNCWPNRFVTEALGFPINSCPGAILASSYSRSSERGHWVALITIFLSLIAGFLASYNNDSGKWFRRITGSNLMNDRHHGCRSGFNTEGESCTNISNS